MINKKNILMMVSIILLLGYFILKSLDGEDVKYLKVGTSDEVSKVILNYMMDELENKNIQNVNDQIEIYSISDC